MAQSWCDRFWATLPNLVMPNMDVIYAKYVELLLRNVHQHITNFVIITDQNGQVKSILSYREP